MVIDKYIGKKINDSVFKLSKKAKEKQQELGKENVINGTLGVFYNEEEQLYSLESVYKEYTNLNPDDIFGYASTIDGDASFKEAVKICTLGRDYESIFKKSFLDVVATIGGTGAIYNTFRNYSNCGEKILLPEYMWGSYKVIAKECCVNHDIYQLFNNSGNFNLENFKDKVLILSKVQKSLIVVINDPCHNPTGYKLSKKEWIEIIEILKEGSKNCKIILLRDIAYSDFDTEQIEIDNIFENLPKNLLVIFAFSISKSFCSYGLRVGAQLAISSSKDVIQEFVDANKHTARGTWSNIPRGPMTMFSNLVLNQKKYEILLEEREKMIISLKERGDIFLAIAKEIGLKTLPYKSGFFLFIPTKDDGNKIIEKLAKENIFTTGNNLGIRVALCSIPKNKLEKFAKKIKEYVI